MIATKQSPREFGAGAVCPNCARSPIMCRCRVVEGPHRMVRMIPAPPAAGKETQKQKGKK
jgi:hypothetical protein